MSTETLVQRAQAELLTLYRGLSELSGLLDKLPNPALAQPADRWLTQLRGALDKLQTRIAEQDKEHAQLRSLFNVSHAINSTLELEPLLTLVSETIT